MRRAVHAGVAQPRGSSAVRAPARRHRTRRRGPFQSGDRRPAGDVGAHRRGSRVSGVSTGGSAVPRRTGVHPARRPRRTLSVGHTRRTHQHRRSDQVKTTAAVVNEKGGEFSLEEVDLNGPRDDEILVRIAATGICHTDIHLKGTLPDGMFPRVFGHEGSGVVEAVGAGVTGVTAGDHVVLSFRSCRTCQNCAGGLSGYCDAAMLLNYMGIRADGSTTYSRDGSAVFGNFFGQSSLSQHAIAYADNCVVIDESVDLIKVAPYGCGFQTGSGTVLNVLKPTADDSLVVYGVGAVGLAALAAAKHLHVGTTIAVDPLVSRRDAAAKYGAVGIDPAAEANVVAKIKELTGG